MFLPFLIGLSMSCRPPPLGVECKGRNSQMSFCEGNRVEAENLQKCRWKHERWCLWHKRKRACNLQSNCPRNNMSLSKSMQLPSI